MKISVRKIMTGDACSVERAAERIMHMRMDDAFALAFILRKLVWQSYYDPTTLDLTTDGTFHVPEITYEDIATLSKVFSKKPCNRTYEGVGIIANNINKLMEGDGEYNGEEGGEQ